MAKIITHKLLSIDLDGTLLSPIFRQVSKSDAVAIQNYISAGGIAFLNSGRIPGAMTSYIKKIQKFGSGKINFISCLNGSYIKDFNDGEVINKTMKHTSAKKILDVVKTVNTKKNVFCWFYFPQDIENNIIESYPLPWWHRFYPYSSVVELQTEDQLECNKITILSMNKQTMQTLYDRLIQCKLENEVKIIQTSKHLIEITPIGADKGFAIKYFAKKYNIPKSSICSIGDTFNDLPAFKESNLSIAIKPANIDLANYINHVIYQKRNGVTKAIEKYLYKEKTEGK